MSSMVTPGMVCSLSSLILTNERLVLRTLTNERRVLPDQHSVDALVLPVDKELGHHHHVLGVHGAVSDPVFLTNERKVLRVLTNERRVVSITWARGWGVLTMNSLVSLS